MPFDPDIHRRRSIRLDGFDYASAGAYFITICTANRECLFGDISEGVMHLSTAGNIVDEEWHNSAVIRAEIVLDAWVIMPNHVHGIVMINEVADLKTGGNVSDDGRRGVRPHAPTPRVGMMGGRPKSLSSFIVGFKSAVTMRINAVRGTSGASIWQRNYYERIIRNERECNAIREYIEFNPMNWAKDEHHVDRVVKK